MKASARFKRGYPLVQIAACLSGIAVLVLIDQALKQLIISRYTGADLPLIGNYIRLYYIENTGAAFSILEGRTPFLVIITAVMVIVCLFLLISRKIPGVLGDISLTLISAGGLGNLTDRIFRGYVVDYIYPKFINFAVFNFADSCVVVGAVLLCIHLLLAEKKGRESRPR